METFALTLTVLADRVSVFTQQACTFQLSLEYGADLVADLIDRITSTINPIKSDSALLIPYLKMARETMAFVCSEWLTFYSTQLHRKQYNKHEMRWLGNQIWESLCMLDEALGETTGANPLETPPCEDERPALLVEYTIDRKE
jgi:hypothetical protein